jgi:hypothetical protein
MPSAFTSGRNAYADSSRRKISPSSAASTATNIGLLERADHAATLDTLVAISAALKLTPAQLLARAGL